MNEAAVKKTLGLISLCRRAGKLCTGMEAVLEKAGRGCPYPAGGGSLSPQRRAFKEQAAGGNTGTLPSLYDADPFGGDRQSRRHHSGLR